MKKNIWILNHYAATMFSQRGGRHYWMAKELKKKGYSPVIFCANVIHNTKEALPLEADYCVEEQDGIIFVIVKTPPYTGNGISRICNMLGFYRNVKRAMKQYIMGGASKPDVIFASHVHPLTCVAGIQEGKKLNIPCIVEIRDLWPAELIAIGAMKETSIIARALYWLERYLYQKADAIVFTMEGGAEYIKYRKWDKDSGGTIDLNKVYYINNGVDIRDFEKDAEMYLSQDEDLNNKNNFNLVYTGSLRRINNIDTLLDTAKELVKEPAIKILLWGAGDYVDQIRKRIQEECLTNVKYKGEVEKHEVPGILVKSDVNIVHWKNMDVLKYGCSYNKLFEYLAAGKPIYSTVHTGYSIIKNSNCGIETEGFTPSDFAKDILVLYQMSQSERNELGENAKKAAKQFDFAILTNRLIEIIERL